MTAPIADTCGRNSIFPATRLGCGEPIATCAEVYRCADCETPFHKNCIRAHFAWERENKKDIELLEREARDAEARGYARGIEAAAKWLHENWGAMISDQMVAALTKEVPDAER